MKLEVILGSKQRIILTDRDYIAAGVKLRYIERQKKVSKFITTLKKSRRF